MTVAKVRSESAGGRLRGRRIASPSAAAAIAFIVSMFMSAMDSQIVNVALPTLSRDFHSSISSVQWTVLAYVVTLAVWIPASGWIGDKIGTKHAFLIALSLFTFASALCGQAHNLPELVAARALQGTGAGMLTPVSMSMMWRAYPPEQRAKVARLTLIPIVIAPATAPVIGGLLVTDLSWRWVFYVNVPIGVAALIFSATHLVEHRESANARFDTAGFILAGGGLSLLLYAVAEGSLVGWDSTRVLTTGFIAVVALSIFVRVERNRGDSALLRVGLFRDRLFRATNIVNGCANGAYLGMLFLTPILLQNARHESALSSGLTTFVASVGSFLGSQSLGRLYRPLGPRRMAIIGALGLSILLLVMCFVGSSTNSWLIRAVMFCLGLSASLIFVSMQTAMFTTIDRSDTGHASAITNAWRQSAVAFAIAIVSTTLASFHGTSFSGFHAGYIAAAIIALGSLVSAFTLIHDADAEATRPLRSD